MTKKFRLDLSPLPKEYRPLALAQLQGKLTSEDAADIANVPVLAWVAIMRCLLTLAKTQIAHDAALEELQKQHDRPIFLPSEARTEEIPKDTQNSFNDFYNATKTLFEEAL